VSNPKDLRELLAADGADAVRALAENAGPAGEPDSRTEAPARKSAQINGRPAIGLPRPGRPLSEFAAELGAVLAPHGMYSRGGHAFHVDATGTKLEAVDPQWIRTWAERNVALYKVGSDNNGDPARLPHSMTLDVASSLVVSDQFLGELPELRRFAPVRMPVMRDGGEIELLRNGFDDATRTLTNPDGCAYATDLDPEAGKAVLDDALSEFPFPDERSKAAAVSAMLTVYADGLLPEGSTVPAFVYLANAEGSGKTTLAMLAGVPYGAPTAKPAPTSETEWQKRLLALTMSGQRLAILDNVRGHLNSPSLEAYLTATRYGDRILGVSKEFEGDADAVILITGNGLTVTPDLRRRCIFIELFMSELRAEDRTFRRRLDAPAMLEMQPDLLAALWALVRGWDEAGRPAPSRDNASSSRWAEIIGGIVEHAGYACPTVSAEIENGGDTDTRDIAALGEVMEPGEGMTFVELVELCAEKGLFDRFTDDRDGDDPGKLSRKAKSAFSRLLKSYDGRFVAETKRFVVKGKGHARRYVVAR
jgi:hypothetical protein